ncbi:modifier of protein aggregation 4-like [Homarus americanus]|uniref:modifier of protein aggregation 4-like n=1 Tax=Homarus americanus TaxID=6706 RepID=UPI001C497798|nr:modifier of protein aggregation 4-like [Homarus americanus]
MTRFDQRQCTVMGGNQRELARAKNAKKQNEGKKGQAAGAKDGNKGMTLEARKQRDAEMMRLKQQKAETKRDDGKK